MKIIIFIAGILLVSSTYAQDSLLYFLSEATRNNPSVLQKYSEYQAALQKVPQVGSLPDPELNMGVFLSPMELLSGNQVADLRLMQMFPWFGTLRAAKDEMSLMANAKYESFRDAKFQVLYEVQLTWYELYKVEQKTKLSEKSIDILRTVERLAIASYKGTLAENVALTDLYRIQIDLGELENSIALLKNQRNTLVAQFNGYLNRPATTPVHVPDSIPAEALNIPLEAVSDSMLAHNPMLGMLAYEQQSLDARKRMVTGMGNPMIGLGLNYSIINKSEMSASTMNGKDMVMPMVVMTLPVYRRKYKAMQAEADLLKTASALNYSASVNNLKTEYFKAVQLYEDAQRRVLLYSGQSLLAGKSLDILIKSFAVSGSGFTDILRVRQQTLDYNYKQTEAVTDFNTAVAWLKRMMAYPQIQQ
jgi:outer membrane protein TolC